MGTGATIALVVTIVVVVDLFIFVVLVPMIVRSYYGPIPAAHPPAEPEPGAVRRNFQSFSFGILNLGMCVHVLADERHLHLRPSLVARLLRVRPASVPWDAIELEPPGRLGRHRNARIAGQHVRGPAWCLELAGRAPAGGA